MKFPKGFICRSRDPTETNICLTELGISRWTASRSVGCSLPGGKSEHGGKYLIDWNQVMDMGEIRTDPNAGGELGPFSPRQSFTCRRVRLRRHVSLPSVQHFT